MESIKRRDYITVRFVSGDWYLIKRTAFDAILNLALNNIIDAILASDITVEETELFNNLGLHFEKEEVVIGEKTYSILKIHRE